MSETVHAWAATEAGGDLAPFEYELGPIGPDEVDIRISHCGICHSDLSMLDDAWEMTQFPLVPGHEVVGTVAAVGIGGLGHLALQFLRAWGCEVTAFSHTPEKEDEARAMGAHHFVSTHDETFAIADVNAAMERLRTGKPRYRIVLEA